MPKSMLSLQKPCWIVKDKDYINVNLTYELDKLTKGISNSVVVSGH
ncbi:hypothetical protein ACVXG9_21425 [Escherichia coli]